MREAPFLRQDKGPLKTSGGAWHDVARFEKLISEGTWTGAVKEDCCPQDGRR